MQLKMSSAKMGAILSRGDELMIKKKLIIHYTIQHVRVWLTIFQGN